MSGTNIVRETYRPMMGVGKLYARPYGSTAALAEVGNVLELAIEHKEKKIKQPNMQTLGGGSHAVVTRIEEANVSIKMGDVNVINLTRALLGTAQAVDAGSVTGEAHKVQRGGLIRLAHIGASAVVVKKAINPVAAPGNYEVRPEGIYVLPGATGLADGDDVTVEYSFVDQAVIEAMTTSAPELELSFGGLNEADSGKTFVVDVWRVSQSVAKQLALVSDKFAQLDVDGEILRDPNKTGVGISAYYRKTVA